MSMNLLVITGRVGSDAVFRAFPNGGGVLSFSVATNSGYGDKEKTLWLRANIFGKRAEGGLAQYLVKGQEVALSGELSENEYNDKNTGETKKSLEINVQNVELIGGRPQGQDQTSRPQGQTSTPSSGGQPQPASPQAGPDYGGGGDMEDIPFMPHEYKSVI